MTVEWYFVGWENTSLRHFITLWLLLFINKQLPPVTCALDTRWYISNEAYGTELAITNLTSKKHKWNKCFIKFHYILNVWIFWAFSALQYLVQCISISVDSGYELITRVEWNNFNTRNAILVIRNFINQIFF